MKIIPVSHGLEDLIGKSGPRSGGLHMSTIYNDLYQDLEPKRYKRGTIPDPLRLEAGLAWEAILETALRERFLKGERPPELVHEEPGCDTPILYNPDLIIFNGKIRVGEIKLTWLSSGKVPREPANCFPPKFDKYICQMMSYGHCLDTNLGRLIAFFVNGPWNWASMGPELLAWDLEFTKQEMDENWRMMMSHARLKGML